MPPVVARVRVAGVVALVVFGLALSSCSDGHSATVASSSGKSSDVDIVVTPARCVSEPSTVPPGVVNFTVSNKNATSVTEVELRKSDGYLLAEEPNLAPGTLGGISADLSAGFYEISCPGADRTTAMFTVAGASTGPGWKKSPQLVEAVHLFTEWMSHQFQLLVTDTGAFASAVEAGNLTEAENLYVPAREDYESIEAASEVYGPLYPDIDGQIEDFGGPSQFEGFHEIEESMWVGGTLSGQFSYAMTLVKDVDQLQMLASTATYQPAQIGDFASAQLVEASNYLVTGSEERYSNLELVDLKGTLDNTQEAISVLAPALTSLSPAVLQQLDGAMKVVSNALAQCERTPGSANSGYESFSDVGIAQREALAQDVLQLAAPVARATQLVA
jgi:iron uptake system component EfeO